MKRSWLILTTLGFYELPDDPTVRRTIEAVQSVLDGPAEQLTSASRISVRHVSQTTSLEVKYVVRAADELDALAVADRVRDVLTERAFQRPTGHITFGRPLQLDG